MLGPWMNAATVIYLETRKYKVLLYIYTGDFCTVREEDMERGRIYIIAEVHFPGPEEKRTIETLVYWFLLITFTSMVQRHCMSYA